MFPKLFTIPAFDLFGRNFGPFSLHMYGVLLVSALLAALWLAGRLAKKQGLDPQKVQDLGIASIIAGLVGAKILLVIVDFDQYRASPRALLDVLQSGGVFYGGLLGGIPVAWWYIKKHGLPLLNTLDILAPAVALGQAVGRLGCFAAGCCYGTPSTTPWSVIFHSEDAHALVGVPLGIPLHPSQLYESLGTFVLMFVLLAVLRNRKFHGQVLSVYLLSYAVLRFTLEFFRGDVARGTVFGGALSTSQFIAILVVFLTLAALPVLARRKPEAA
ncbi:MAG: prolipoprotein diacylglyceryl transferase [Vicinamibacteria bacterium]|nr:prolipoprotein diacylglyceryl transferase [Vicinamibacteria bacterium]